jgi:hypothetical protein
MSSVIRVENLSKRYLLRHQAERGGSHRYVALRDVVTDKVRRLFQKRKAESGKRKAESGRRKEEGGRRKAEGKDIEQTTISARLI